MRRGDTGTRRRAGRNTHFVSKLSDAEVEAEETRVWLQFASRCGYLTNTRAEALDEGCNKIFGQLVKMISDSEQWTIH